MTISANGTVANCIKSPTGSIYVPVCNYIPGRIKPRALIYVFQIIYINLTDIIIYDNA